MKFIVERTITIISVINLIWLDLNNLKKAQRNV